MNVCYFDSFDLEEVHKKTGVSIKGGFDSQKFKQRGWWNQTGKNVTKIIGGFLSKSFEN